MGHINFLPRLEISAHGGPDSTLSVTTIKGVINIKANHHFQQFSFWVAAVTYITVAKLPKKSAI